MIITRTAGQITSVHLGMNGVDMALQPSPIPLWAETWAMMEMGQVNCQYCRRGLMTDRTGGRAIFCPSCEAACARVTNDHGEVGYWQTLPLSTYRFTRHQYMPSATAQPPKVVVEGQWLGIKWTTKAYQALYPMGMLLVGCSLFNSPAILTKMGARYNLERDVTAGSTYARYVDEWMVVNLSKQPPVDSQSTDSNCITLQRCYGFLPSETGYYSRSIEMGSRLIERVWLAKHQPETDTEFHTVLKALNLTTHVFDQEAWKVRVNSALGGFGGVERVMRKVKKAGS